ncbi:MAG: 4Fe-4S dicluster domain-containing protein [Defluviitaleaceae bacterium]|nr:4Fe-4S dicluster domain-containing protein [Defluviitaleaceae bacterium]
MAKVGFAFNMRRCVACKTCQVACKDKNNLNGNHFFRRAITLPSISSGSVKNFSAACCHCENPACVDGCEAGAMRKNEDGTVTNDLGRCTGCGACAWNCPYGAPKLHAIEGVSRKCDACADQRKLGKKPACVQACPTFALDFGDLSELEKEWGSDVTRHPPIANNSTTNPSILIKY